MCVRVTNESTYRIYQDSLTALDKRINNNFIDGGTTHRMISILYSNSLQPSYLQTIPPWKPINQNLNEPQIHAIQQALKSQDVHIICMDNKYSFAVL